MIRYISTVLSAVFAGACISNLPVLVLIGSGMIVAVRSPNTDATRTTWPEIMKAVVVLSLWTVPGATNGALGICVGRGRANRWVFLPACAACPAFIAFAQLDWYPPRSFDFVLMAISFVMAGFIWLAGEAVRVFVSRNSTGSNRARIMSMATSEVAAALRESSSRLQASRTAWNGRILLVTIAFVAGTVAASMYFIFLDRTQRQSEHGWELRNERQRTDAVREDFDRAKEQLQRQVAFERNGREAAEKKLEELLRGLAKNDPLGK
jgi:hypothetical protein